MAKININGKDFEVAAGKNLVDAAEENGIDIPHYCYHPGLSVAGQCRMCYVEIEGNPKLQIGCNIRCSDGLKVVTDSPRVKDAVKWSLEFHLINHPIDCPICDQAGECGLQDYYMEHGKYDSQMREHKVNKQKVVDLGDRIVLDKERCILCGRCVRFTQEVSKTAELGIYNRGDRSVVGTVNDLPMTDNYQVNTVDICPVGALTSKDFRFEQRVWFLKESSSVCNGCSKGCNVFVHHKSGKHIYRLKPRYNEQVNGHWMCDEGRPTYKASNYDRRLTTPMQGGIEMPISEAIQSWANDLRSVLAMERSDEVGVWIHPDLTNEEIQAIHQSLHKTIGVNQFFSMDVEAIRASDKLVDQLLKRADPYCNSFGFSESLASLKIKALRASSLIELVTRKKITHLILIVGEKSFELEVLKDLPAKLSLDCFVTVLSPQQLAADIFPMALAIPTISHYEKNGSIKNCDGITQKLASDFRMFRSAWSIEEVLTTLVSEYQKPSRSEASVQ